MTKRRDLRVVIVAESDACLVPRKQWLDWLSSLASHQIQPIVVTESSDLIDELVETGICPVQFPLAECICLSTERRAVIDFARFLVHLQADLVVVFGKNWIVPQRAGAVAQIPVAIEVSEKLSDTRQLFLLAAHETDSISLIVRTREEQNRLGLHFGNLGATVVVLPFPDQSGQQPGLDQSCITALRELAKQGSVCVKAEDFLLRTITLYPQYASPNLELCQTPRNHPIDDGKQDEFEQIEVTNSLQTAFVPGGKNLSTVGVIFIMSKLVKCICDIADHQIGITIRSPLNPEVALRKLSLPLRSIANRDWTELSFERLDHVDKYGIIIEFGAAPEVRQRVLLQTLVRKNKRDDRLPALIAK